MLSLAAGTPSASSSGPRRQPPSLEGVFGAEVKRARHDDENIGNILEHAANTAVGLTANGTTAMLVTTDGFDGCLFDPTCGINAFSLAYLLRDALGAATAVAMDQGGSTTMWTAAAGVVSNSSTGGGTRTLFSGLFVAAAPAR